MRKTQTSDILQHLKDGRRLTQKEAVNEYSAYRLSSVIFQLRKQGYDIISIPIAVPTRYMKEDGTPRVAFVTEYKLRDKKAESLTKDKKLADLLSRIKPDENFDKELLEFIESISH